MGSFIRKFCYYRVLVNGNVCLVLLRFIVVGILRVSLGFGAFIYLGILEVS